MALDYATDHLRGALLTLGSSEGPPLQRLQRAWTDNVQMLWMRMCLPDALNAQFRQLWERYTAPADDAHATTLRELDSSECTTAISEVIDLAVATVAADARGEEPAQP